MTTAQKSCPSPRLTNAVPLGSLGGSPVPAVSSEEQHEDDNILQHILHFARDKLRQAANPAPLLDPDHTRYPMVRSSPPSSRLVHAPEALHT